MAINIIKSTKAIPKLKLETFKVSAADKTRLTDALSEIKRLDGILEEIGELKSYLETAGARFAAGELSMAEAVSVLAVSQNSTDRGYLQGALRSPIKQALKDVYASVEDIVQAARAGKLEQMKTKCAELETQEREAADNLGILPDDFEPSPTLCRLRESHSRSAQSSTDGNSRDALHRLAEELGLSI